MFYPAGRQRPKGFDELAYYAEHFNTVEVNSTFYGQPRAEVAEAWRTRTPAGFEFSIKLYQKFTHPRLFKDRLARSTETPAGRRGSLPRADEATIPDAMLDALARPNQADLDAFRSGIEPLAASGRLGALLAQFPASFVDAPASRNYLAGLIEAFRGYPLAVELRHRTWSDNIDATLRLLNELGAAWVQIDEPKFRFSIRQNYLPNVTTFYYMRLHGRNASKWWQHDHPEDRYNYLYSTEELKEFVDTAGAARRLVKKMYLYTNNHFSAKSVANAAMIKHQLGEPLPGDYRAELVDRYPELGSIVSARPAVRSLLE